MADTIVDKENHKFIRHTSNTTSVRVTKMPMGFIDGLDYDEITFAYPNSTTETITYKLGGSTVQTLEVKYTNSSKNDLLYVKEI